MRKFLRGGRALSPSRVLATVAVVLVCSSVIALGLDVRSTAKDSQRLAQHAVATERAVLTAIVLGCERRQTYDQRFITASADDLANYRASLANARAQLSAPIVANSPELTAIVQRGIAILEHAIASKQKIVDAGTVGNCSKYKQLLADLPPA